MNVLGLMAARGVIIVGFLWTFEHPSDKDAASDNTFIVGFVNVWSVVQVQTFPVTLGTCTSVISKWLDMSLDNIPQNALRIS